MKIPMFCSLMKMHTTYLPNAACIILQVPQIFLQKILTKSTMCGSSHVMRSASSRVAWSDA
jgi:hypothetical protein